MSEGGNPDGTTGTTPDRRGTHHGFCTSVRRRLVGRTLRRYRENLGYTLEDAARVLECDRSKISRIETGERGIRGKELRELLTEYGVAEEQQAVLARWRTRAAHSDGTATTPTSCPAPGRTT